MHLRPTPGSGSSRNGKDKGKGTAAVDPRAAVARGHTDAAAATDYLFTSMQSIEPIPRTLTEGAGAGAAVAVRPPAPEQYLCTGYDVYCTVEPAPMECMSLVHARVRRVFVGSEDTGQGALFSCMRLQEVQRMNHKYAVYRCMSSSRLRAACREAAVPLLGPVVEAAIGTEQGE